MVVFLTLFLIHQPITITHDTLLGWTGFVNSPYLIWGVITVLGYEIATIAVLFLYMRRSPTLTLHKKFQLLFLAYILFIMVGYLGTNILQQTLKTILPLIGGLFIFFKCLVLFIVLNIKDTHGIFFTKAVTLESNLAYAYSHLLNQIYKSRENKSLGESQLQFVDDLKRMGFERYLEIKNNQIHFKNIPIHKHDVTAIPIQILKEQAHDPQIFEYQSSLKDLFQTTLDYLGETSYLEQSKWKKQLIHNYSGILLVLDILPLLVPPSDFNVPLFPLQTDKPICTAFDVIEEFYKDLQPLWELEIPVLIITKYPRERLSKVEGIPANRIVSLTDVFSRMIFPTTLLVEIQSIVESKIDTMLTNTFGVILIFDGIDLVYQIKQPEAIKQWGMRWMTILKKYRGSMLLSYQSQYMLPDHIHHIRTWCHSQT